MRYLMFKDTRVPLSYDFDHFLDSGAEICQISCWFFGTFKNQKDILKLTDLWRDKVCISLCGHVSTVKVESIYITLKYFWNISNKCCLP